MIGPLKIAPSDLTFLWDECQRCFYDKVRLGKPRPSGPFPSIFGKLDAAQKNFYAGGSSRRMYGDLPEGEVGYDDMTLESEAIGFDDVGASMFIRGRIDAAMRFNDGTFGIVDYKTSEPKRHHVEFYGRQLHAYMYAAEHPAMGRPGSQAHQPYGAAVLHPARDVRAGGWQPGAARLQDVGRDSARRCEVRRVPSECCQRAGAGRPARVGPRSARPAVSLSGRRMWCSGLAAQVVTFPRCSRGQIRAWLNLIGRSPRGCWGESPRASWSGVVAGSR